MKFLIFSFVCVSTDSDYWRGVAINLMMKPNYNQLSYFKTVFWCDFSLSINIEHQHGWLESRGDSLKNWCDLLRFTWFTVIYLIYCDLLWFTWFTAIYWDLIEFLQFSNILILWKLIKKFNVLSCIWYR